MQPSRHGTKGCFCTKYHSAELKTMNILKTKTKKNPMNFSKAHQVSVLKPCNQQTLQHHAHAHAVRCWTCNKTIIWHRRFRNQKKVESDKKLMMALSSFILILIFLYQMLCAAQLSSAQFSWSSHFCLRLFCVNISTPNGVVAFMFGEHIMSKEKVCTLHRTHLNDSHELFMHAVKKLSLRWFRRQKTTTTPTTTQIDEIRIRTFILMFSPPLFFISRRSKKIHFLLFTVYSVGTSLSLWCGVCLFLFSSLLCFIVVCSRAHITYIIERESEKRHIKLCRQEINTHTHAIRFDNVWNFSVGTGRYSRNMRAWMTTTIMLKVVVMTTRIIASIKLRTNLLYQTLLMIEQWIIFHLRCSSFRQYSVLVFHLVALFLGRNLNACRVQITQNMSNHFF